MTIFLIRDPQAIQEAIQELKEKGLVLKIGDNLNNYLSCDTRFSDKRTQSLDRSTTLYCKLTRQLWRQSEQIAELCHSRDSNP